MVVGVYQILYLVNKVKTKNEEQKTGLFFVVLLMVITHGFHLYYSFSNNHGFKIKLTSSSSKVTLVHLNTQ